MYEYIRKCVHLLLNNRIDLISCFVLVFQIKPLSGPIEGGTMVTIEGSNLGLKEEDVKGKIHIGDTPCNLVEYEVSVRIVCQTGPSLTEKVASVIIGNQAGYTESSVHFSYKVSHLVWYSWLWQNQKMFKYRN